jgi:hypothetical protein
MTITSGLVTNYYGDLSYWSGFFVRLLVAVSNSSINGIAPIALMTKQSTRPIFADGVNSQGLIGVGFSALASNQEKPISVVDAWYEQGAIQKNEIAIHGCPYQKMDQAWIDFGNETPYDGCSGYSVTIAVPSKTYFTLNILDISINGIKSPLSFSWQAHQYSILDSCTSSILLPLTTVSTLKASIKESGALSSRLSKSQYLDKFLNQDVSLKLNSSDFDWDMMPNVSITLLSGYSSFQNVTLVLGPRQYLQSDNSGYCRIIKLI